MPRPLIPLPHTPPQALGSINRYSGDAAKEVLKAAAWLVTAAQEEVLPHRERLGERANLLRVMVHPFLTRTHFFFFWGGWGITWFSYRAVLRQG